MRVKGWGERLLAAALGSLIVLGALEVGLRALAVGFRWQQASREEPPISPTGEAGHGSSLTILCIGESTTAMGGTDAWPNQLERVLAERLPGTRVAMFNRGVPGADSSVLMSRLHAQLDELAPDVVVAMMGANDGFTRAIPGSDEPLAERRGWLPRLRTGQLARQVLHTWAHGAESPDGQVVPRWNHVEGPWAAPCSAGSLRDHWVVSLARAQVGAGEVEGALRRLERAVASRPGSALLNEELGVVLLGLGYVERADLVLARAAALDPDAASVSLERARLCEVRAIDAQTAGAPGLGALWAEEARLLRRALEQDPERIVALGHLARVLKHTDPAAAAAVERQARALAPRLPELIQVKDDVGGASGGAHGVASAASDAACPLTRRSYRQLQDEVRARGAVVVAVQYPRQPVAALRGMLDPQTLVVDNQAAFDAAVAERGLAAVFQDSCCGNFGHATALGNRILAEHVAEVVLAARASDRPPP